MQNNLADKRQVILILRLTLDANGQLVHGEVAELAGMPIGRFVEWPKLPPIVRAWVISEDEDGPLNSFHSIP